MNGPESSPQAGSAPFAGVGVALVTLFDERGEADPSATAELASRLVGCGVRSVLVAGSTGEASALEPSERAALVSAVRAVLPDDVPVLAGSGAPSARQASILTSMVIDAGADLVLALAPPQSSDPRAYYDALAEVAGTDRLLAYHFPAVSQPGIPVPVLPELPVCGVKDSSGDLLRLYDEVRTFGGAIYTGSANLVCVAGMLGCSGAILAIANVCPELAISAFGDRNVATPVEPAAKAQLALYEESLRVSKGWPRSLKEAVAARWGTSTVCRMG